MTAEAIWEDEEIPAATANGHADMPDYSLLFDAPDYASWLKTTQTKQSREYEQKAQSFLKLWMTGAINGKNWADAAAILDRGPAFANAVGEYADSDPRVAKAIDMIMAPDAPIAKFILTAIPLVSQIARNHEKQLADIPLQIKKTRAQRKAEKQAAPEGRKVQIGLGKLKVSVKLPKFAPRLGMFIAGFRGQTEDPNQLAAKVFTNDRVVDALRKQGIYIES